jgi:hypothetical protein
MVRSNTERVSAEMIDHVTRRDRTDEKFVDRSMRVNSCSCFTDLDLTVPSIIFGSGPHPTAIINGEFVL